MTDPLDRFYGVVATQTAAFPTARLPQLILARRVRMDHYDAILRTLFHQTYAGPYTFARAAVNCSWRHERAKEYLLHHANEESGHWRWVLDDVAAIGRTVEGLRESPPHPTCAAYIGLLHYYAEQVPIARLAIAAVLEGIAGAHGGTIGEPMIRALGLKPSQATFLLRHGETDKIHSEELRDVNGICRLSPEEWRWMEHAATTAGALYRAMYDHDAFLLP